VTAGGRATGARAALSAATSAVLSALLSSGALRQLLRRWRPGAHAADSPADRWTRTNHRGEPISLLEGPAFAVGALAGVALVPGAPARVRSAALVAGAAAAALGAYDDLAEQQVRKGVAGHLGALAHGEVTTGAVKIVGLTVSGLAASALVGRGSGRAASGAGALADVLVGGAVVAGCANLVNLLDLRPGRALKATLLAAPFVGAGLPVAAATAGAAVGVLPEDLAERTMLGDTGANAAGAALAVALAAGATPRLRLGLLTGVVALTAASEVVSFSAVIERTAPLRTLDRLGRRAEGP